MIADGLGAAERRGPLRGITVGSHEIFQPEKKRRREV